MRRVNLAAFLVAAFVLSVASATCAQGPYYPPAPGMQPPVPGQQAAPGPQQPTEYAFRPDLTNPQYGECLGLERNWQELSQRYAMEYQRAAAMNPRSPEYAQMTRYMQGLRQQVDQAWNIFSSKCIYYRTR
jgi:hypothetical protein